MTRSLTFQSLLDGHKVRSEGFSDDQVVGFWSKAIEAYKDSASSPRSWNGQFRDLYESGRLAATAIIAAGGYRAHGPDHHRSAIVAAAELCEGTVSEAFYTVEGARGNRHDTNYGSADVVEAQDVSEIRTAIEVLLSDGAKQLRNMRPSAKKRLRVTQPKARQGETAQ